MVHLDLKPQNILMDDTMMPKIADFGLSQLFGAQKSRTIVSAGNRPGTLGYMAPEYLFQGIISPKADIFSFGVIIIEIITGVREYPLCAVQSFQEVNDNGSCESTEESLKKYRDNVIGRWRNVFKKEPKHTSPEIYTEQVEQCITTALKCLKDSTSRPIACDISQMLTGEICKCKKKTTLLSAQPPKKLCFQFTENHEVTSCPLQLTNNTDDVVAFRIEMNDREKYFPWPVHGLVLPRSIYKLRVALSRPHEDDNCFSIILESTITDEQKQLLEVQASGSDNYNRLFRADEKGREVQQRKLLFVIEHEPGKMIMSGHPPHHVNRMSVHPAKTWIITMGSSADDVKIWDYQKQQTVDSSEFVALDYNLRIISARIFVPRKQWFVIGSASGHIKVYSYETTQEVKAFQAHDKCVLSFDIHPSEPYLLSASYLGSTVKLWNWEKDWECVRTIEMQVWFVKFNPKDADYIACTTDNDVKVLNIASPGIDDLVFSLDQRRSRVFCLEYLTRVDELYLITGHADGTVEVWDWQSRSCVIKLEEHTSGVNTICVHPDLPIIITGSNDGKVCLWNSFTFKLESKLNCRPWSILAIAYLKGSNRIAIGHRNGFAITEI